MNSPSSYLFYDQMSNPKEQRTEGAKLTRVIISDDKIIKYSNVIFKRLNTEVLYEKTLTKQIFSLHTNRNGEKYLKSFSKDYRGFNDDSLDVFINGKKPMITSNILNDTCSALIRETILGWFPDEMYAPLIECQNKLLFPALRDKAFPQNPTMGHIFAQLQMTSSPVTKALRENNSWDSFIADICKHTVKTATDISLIKQSPEALLPIAVMNLGITLSALEQEITTDLSKISQAFDGLDLNYIKFMFKHLPKTDKSKIRQVLLNLVALKEKNEAKGLSFYHYRYVDPRVDLSSVPVNLRSELAKALARQLTKKYKTLKANPSDISMEGTVPTGLNKACKRWFATYVLAPQMKTKVTIEGVQNRFNVLFGMEILGDASPLKLIKTGKTVFCLISDIYESSLSLTSDPLYSLEQMVHRNKPKGRGVIDLNSYIYGDKLIPLSSGRVYSLSDIMDIIERGVIETDQILAKLGRQNTPAHRAAFLTMQREQRKFKNTWKYYDLGVTDPYKILILKRNKIFGTKDIETYSALPDEMFYEFLALSSGESILL